jgi:hypothetical protein
MTSNIECYDDLLIWENTTGGRNNIEIVSDFSIPVSASPLVLDLLGNDDTVSVVINGNGHVITINENDNMLNFHGLFKLSDNGSKGNFEINDLGFNCVYVNQPTRVRGVLIGSGSNAGNEYCLSINKCYVDGKLLVEDGGFVSSNLENFQIKDCYIKGAVLALHNNGIMCGRNCTNGTILCSYVSGKLNKSKSGAFCGLNCVGMIIKNCYSNCELTHDHCGGIVGPAIDNSLIENCYALGNMKHYACGGICGTWAKDNVIIKNCYFNGTMISSINCAGISPSTGPTITNCYATHAITDVGANGLVAIGSGVGLSNSGYGSGIWDENMDYLLNNYGSHVNIWKDANLDSPPQLNAPYMLSCFANEPWNHTTYDNDDGYSLCVPFIKIFEEDEECEQCDSLMKDGFSFFDNNDNNRKRKHVVMHGDFDEWSTKKYVNKMVICVGGRKILIDTDRNQV